MGNAAPEAPTRGQPGVGVRKAAVAHSHRPSLKLVLFTIVVAVLGGVVGVAISRETAPTSQATTASRPALPTPRPALAPAEDAYIQSLWPIHTSVERAAVRVALGASFYKLQDLSRPDLETRLDEALNIYRVAGQRLRDLTPPASLQVRHAAYLEAVGMFEQSTLEMLRMFSDGSDQHLVSGFPLSVQGSDKIREVGEAFWPDEYPPN